MTWAEMRKSDACILEKTSRADGINPRVLAMGERQANASGLSFVQIVNTSQGDQWAGIGQDDASHSSKVSMSRPVSSSCRRTTAIPNRETCEAN